MAAMDEKSITVTNSTLSSSKASLIAEDRSATLVGEDEVTNYLKGWPLHATTIA